MAAEQDAAAPMGGSHLSDAYALTPLGGTRSASGGKSRIVEANIAGTSFSTECSCMGLRAAVDEFAPHTFSERNVPLAMSSRASGRIAAVELSKQACGQHADKEYAHT